MPAFHTVLFDLDGTLLNTLPDLTDSVNYALALRKLPPCTQDQVRTYVGNGVAQLIHLAVPPQTDAALEAQCLFDFRAHYLLNMDQKTAPYPGVLALLDRLNAAGVQVAVVSNKFDGAVKGLCQNYFGQRVPVAIGEVPGIRRKPAPDAVFRALAELDAAADGAVYIGDSETDLLTAQNAGLPFLAAGWGFRDAAFLRAQGAAEVLPDLTALTARLFPTA